MEIFWFIIIILVASILQTSTGFGFSILATPLLLLMYAPVEAIQINLIVSLAISCLLVTKIRKDIDFDILKRFVAGSVIGLPIGIAIFSVVDLNALKLGISVVILIVTVMLIFKFRINQTQGRDLFAGGISGALTSSIGMPGPPLLVYFSITDIPKERLRATTLAFYLFIYLLSLIFQLIFAETNKTIWISSIGALPLVLLGMYLGQLLFKYISQQVFRIITYAILLFTGIYLMINSF